MFLTDAINFCKYQEEKDDGDDERGREKSFIITSEHMHIHCTICSYVMEWWQDNVVDVSSDGGKHVNLSLLIFFITHHRYFPFFIKIQGDWKF